MKIEISIYILVAIGCFIARTVISGRKNGCFYYKNSNPLPPLLEKPIKNLHFIETPAWYTQTIGVFFLLFSICRLLNPTFEWQNILIQLGITSLITIGSYTAASYHYQRGVTGGLLSDDKLDIDYGNKSEVALEINNKVLLQFWKPRWFANRGRIVAQWIGIIEILVGIALMFVYL